VIVYIVPWCGSCSASLQAYRQLADLSTRSKELGFMVVIGRDSEENLQAMADKIGAHTFIDATSSFFEKASVNRVPTWILINRGHRILQRVERSVYSAEEILSSLGLDEQYGQDR
jgi:hypothetical protein